MSLVAANDPARPGLFVDPHWTEGTPGTFAVVVGVSRYPHLADGEAPVGETYGLGQLHVSAATAYRFFRWLCNGYDFDGAPPARCWLLLSPTPEEQQTLSLSTTAAGAAEATLSNCMTAIEWWAHAMAQLPRPAAERSRGVFFFSGHGLEVWQEQQILLPSDYLRPPLGNVNDALSTANLRRGLSCSPVPNQYLFLDACRNDVPRLRELDVQGRKILNEPGAAAVNPDALFGTLYAAASGTQTWQPRELADGSSIFGGALVDGLEGRAGIELKECTANECEVWFYPLETFVKTRMAEVLQQFQSTEKVRVRNGGTPPDGGITLVPVAPSGSQTVRLSPGGSGPLLDARYDIRHVEQWAVTGDWATGHAIFGSERMTDIWQITARAHRLVDGVEVPRDEIVFRSVQHSSDIRTFRVDLALPPSREGHWLQFTDAIGSDFACVLPGDRSGDVVHRLEIDLERGARPGDPSWVARVEAGLAPNDGPLADMTGVWQTYQTHNPADAVSALDLRRLESAVLGKQQSPLAAAVAASVLLRAGRLDLIHETWLRNLSDWFDELPDGPVLWAEQLRLSTPPGDVAATAERIEHLIRLTWRGLPRLAEVLPLAGRQLAELAPLDTRLVAVRGRVEAVLRHYRPGGLFATFCALPGFLHPSLVR